ncbi:calcitonin gene-related peptide type 1 receptor [Aplysia californica]|uniref:Calcitonin gene-related peptide type 1 receptor n=1 Tax=Aplysia californica TaxID=6500 RepID=A0ABM0JBH7_APLCA|nr:calcitonin gene-related peptide type 1 receptor [Aplysia californica]
MATVRLGFSIVFVVIFQIVSTVGDGETCRSKFGNFRPEEFRLHACAWCYRYMTQSMDFGVHPTMHYLVVVNNLTIYPQWTILVPDSENATLAALICQTTSSDLCMRWKSCCREARRCCQHHLAAPPQENGTCPRTWDGYGCWEDTRPDTTVYNSCPSFLQFSISSRYAEKHCTSNGTWSGHGNDSSGQLYEWTDYTKCLDKDSLLASIYLGLACNVASIALLVPAIGIFILYRSLRRQHRIRLHINFFVALVVSDLMAVMWDMLVAHDRLVAAGTDEGTLFNNGGGCTFLAFLRLYSKSTTYVWMFCEGFYLHRLISNAFKPPKSLLFLYLIGWGAPLGYTSVYGVLRLIYDNERCWVRSSGELQWILYTPNLLCLIVNFFFLCNILRILLTQLQSHPNEPSNFRRALKATFVLIPLFGVQLFVTIYRLPAGRAGAAEYEKFTVFVLNSQGFFVALIFCFFNGEVITHVKRTCTRFRLMRLPTEASRNQTTATSVNFVHHGQDSHESENGNLMYESPRPSPGSGKKLYNSIELSERKYPYIPLSARKQSPSPTEI